MIEQPPPPDDKPRMHLYVGSELAHDFKKECDLRKIDYSAQVRELMEAWVTAIQQQKDQVVTVTIKVVPECQKTDTPLL